MTISTIFAALSLWTHTLATIVLVGHYWLLAMVYLPALRRSLDEKTLLANTLAGFVARMRPLMLAALLVFAVSGVYLTVGNNAYEGLGQFVNPWSVLMLSKHIIILLMIVLAFRFDAQTRKTLPVSSWLLNAISACGLLVLLLTAAAQVLP